MSINLTIVQETMAQHQQDLSKLEEESTNDSDKIELTLLIWELFVQEMVSIISRIGRTIELILTNNLGDEYKILVNDLEKFLVDVYTAIRESERELNENAMASSNLILTLSETRNRLKHKEKIIHKKTDYLREISDNKKIRLCKSKKLLENEIEFLSSAQKVQEKEIMRMMGMDEAREAREATSTLLDKRLMELKPGWSELQEIYKYEEKLYESFRKKREEIVGSVDKNDRKQELLKLQVKYNATRSRLEETRRQILRESEDMDDVSKEFDTLLLEQMIIMLDKNKKLIQKDQDTTKNDRVPGKEKGEESVLNLLRNSDEAIANAYEPYELKWNRLRECILNDSTDLQELEAAIKDLSNTKEVFVAQDRINCPKIEELKHEHRKQKDEILEERKKRKMFGISDELKGTTTTKDEMLALSEYIILLGEMVEKELVKSSTKQAPDDTEKQSGKLRKTSDSLNSLIEKLRERLSREKEKLIRCLQDIIQELSFRRVLERIHGMLQYEIQ